MSYRLISTKHDYKAIISLPPSLFDVWEDAYCAFLSQKSAGSIDSIMVQDGDTLEEGKDNFIVNDVMIVCE